METLDLVLSTIAAWVRQTPVWVGQDPWTFVVRFMWLAICHAQFCRVWRMTGKFEWRYRLSHSLLLGGSAGAALTNEALWQCVGLAGVIAVQIAHGIQWRTGVFARKSQA